MADIIASPLNYTGGKYKLLPQILPLFPTEIDTFYDMFCGGCNVGINICTSTTDKDSILANKVVYNDINKTLLGIINYIKDTPTDKLLKQIESVIKEYNLSNTKVNGYSIYNCDSASGLATYNKTAYLKLRNDVNTMRKTKQYYLKLYVLIVYAFNNQIRFNSNGAFNLPVGKRDFNQKMVDKLKQFSSVLELQKCEFKSCSFTDYRIENFNSSDFAYCDPPYLITTAAYNENNAWTEVNEKQLLDYLSLLDENNIKFALSNVLTHKGRTNLILQEWSKKYNVHHLNYNYNNSSYQAQKTEEFTDEVLITNY